MAEKKIDAVETTVVEKQTDVITNETEKWKALKAVAAALEEEDLYEAAEIMNKVTGDLDIDFFRGCGRCGYFFANSVTGRGYKISKDGTSYVVKETAPSKRIRLSY